MTAPAILVATDGSDEFAGQLRERIEDHLRLLQLASVTGETDPAAAKRLIRVSHEAQRRDFMAREARALGGWLPRLLPWFAEGSEVRPGHVQPVLVPAEADHESGFLFRLATTMWSVPVSRGYGRRMRFLVIDAANGKLIGVLALGDPVFNLRVRDTFVGWTVRQRERNLVAVMDAYVAGAVPPYSMILGGKLVTSLIGSREIGAEFDRRYGTSTGIISGKAKRAQLAMVTVTSALGRSSQYNRLRLPGLEELIRIGRTEGWGHFQVPEGVFADMRELLKRAGHPYASGHQFGEGPNWRIRVIREALKLVGLDPDLLRHGISRDVYAMPLAANWQRYLQGLDSHATLDRPTAQVISQAAVARWVAPRATRDESYLSWTAESAYRAIVQPLLASERGSISPVNPANRRVHGPNSSGGLPATGEGANLEARVGR